MNCSKPGLPVHHQLPEFMQTHVHWIDDDIKPSHPLSSPSLPAFNLSQHQGLFTLNSNCTNPAIDSDPDFSHRVEVSSCFQIYSGTTSQESRCLQKPSLKSLLSLMWKCSISPALELSGKFGLWMIGWGGLPMASCPGEKRRASVPAYHFIFHVLQLWLFRVLWR